MRDNKMIIYMVFALCSFLGILTELFPSGLLPRITSSLGLSLVDGGLAFWFFIDFNLNSRNQAGG